MKKFVSLNIATSLDGKIATNRRGPIALGTPYDRRRMLEIRALHDVVIMGAKTFLAYPKPLHVKEKRLQARRLRQGMSIEPATAIVSSRLDIPSATAWERDTRAPRIVFCGRSASPKEIRRLRRAGVYVALCAAERPAAEEILEELAALGMHRVLVEGGGELNATFLEADLVTRAFITLCPWMIGGRESPTLFEGNGFLKNQFTAWKLQKWRRLKSELYLEYSR